MRPWGPHSEPMNHFNILHPKKYKSTVIQILITVTIGTQYFISMGES